jgi:heme-degrading monooxygenase HmoA
VIARVGRFLNLTEDEAARRRANLLERWLPALERQEGFVYGFWLENGDREWLSITVWESEEALAAGAKNAGRVPLLHGQSAELIQSPDSVERFDVIGRAGQR